MLIRPKPDRRSSTRLVPPTCPKCTSPTEPLAVVSRHGDAVKFKCPQCGYEIGAQKPH